MTSPDLSFPARARSQAADPLATRAGLPSPPILDRVACPLPPERQAF